LDEFKNDDKKVCLEGCDHVVHSKCFFSYANYTLRTSTSVLCPICRHMVIKIDSNHTSRFPERPSFSNIVLVSQEIPHTPTSQQVISTRQRVLTGVVCTLLGLNLLYLMTTEAK
jgi:hypothetical protein